jgi:ABC-type polysaccharide/polyol phosphate export permease
MVTRGSVPASALWAPLIVIPQAMLTAGLCYWLVAAGVFFRDLVYIVSLSLTLWFFLTPICYPETALPPELAPVLQANPVYQLVRAYRAVLVEGRAPEAMPMAVLTGVAALALVGGYAYFKARQRDFADVL